jgi:hypothetical protein
LQAWKVKESMLYFKLTDEERWLLWGNGIFEYRSGRLD